MKDSSHMMECHMKFLSFFSLNLHNVDGILLEHSLSERCSAPLVSCAALDIQDCDQQLCPGALQLRRL